MNFYLVRWNEYHSISGFFDLWKFHQFGSTVLPETLLEYAGILMVADLEQLDMMDASEFYNIKLNAKDMISPKLVTIPQKQKMDKKNIGGDQVLRTPILTMFHPSSRRSSRRLSCGIRRVPTNHQSRKSLNINTVYT